MTESEIAAIEALVKGTSGQPWFGAQRSDEFILQLISEVRRLRAELNKEYERGTEDGYQLCRHFDSIERPE